MATETAIKGNWKNFSVKDLDEKGLQELIELIRPLYTWFSPTRATDSNIRARLTRDPNSQVDIIEYQGKVIAWGVYYTREINNAQKILYRGGTIVDREYTSKGIYHALIQIALEREKPDYLVTRTQNPRVYEAFEKCILVGTVIYPQLDGTIPPPNIQKIAQLVEPNVDLETLIVRGLYEGNRFYADYHTSRDPKVQEFFQKKLNPPDAFVVIAPL